jgi:hypothetical protein
LSGQRAHQATDTVHEHSLAADGPAGEHRPVRGDARDADVRLPSGRWPRPGDRRSVSGTPRWPARRPRTAGRTVPRTPIPARPGRVRAEADRVDDPVAVAVRHDPTERHRRAQPGTAASSRPPGAPRTWSSAPGPRLVQASGRPHLGGPT